MGTSQSRNRLIGGTALTEAASSGDIVLVRHLLAAGADLDARSYYGNTALMVAARRGHADIVDLLLAQPGIDINAKSGRYSLTALAAAAQNGHAAVVRQLLAAGADVDAKTYNGATALIWAAAGGQAAMVRQLLAAGADLDARDNYGNTALEIAEVLHEEDGWEEHFDVVRAIERFLTEQVTTLWIHRHSSRQRDRLGLSELERGTSRLGLSELNRGTPLMDRLVYYIQGFL